MTRGARQSHARGFSLIEVMLAIVLLIALVGGLYSFIDGLRTASQVADARAGQMAAAEAVLDELEQSLATTFVSGRDGVGGVVGDGAHLSVRSRAWAFQPGASDVGGCELKLDSQGLSAQRIVGGKAQVWESIPAVAGLRLRYHVGNEWKTSFDSAQAGELPAAVEVSLWLGAGAEPAEAGEGGAADLNATTLRAADRVRVIAVHDAPSATGGGA
ncbi:MAG: prepilin-type N-terminal cleavage/methylation domain-containing protein [Phycisphaerales bacterium]|jgi:prepilin-type N-terminal cleavage/methylation domain-containing protein